MEHFITFYTALASYTGIVYNFFLITSTNLNIFLQFLAQIILTIRCIASYKFNLKNLIVTK